MAQRTPTIEGFRVIFRRPSLGLAEITWRWTFGAAAFSLLAFSFFEYLDTLPVTSGEALFLRSRHPFLVSQALAHILAGSGERLAAASLIVAVGLIVFWVLASSIGRVATVRRLFDYFGSDLASVSPATEVVTRERSAMSWHLSSMLALNAFRTTLLLAGLLAFGGAGTIGGLLSTPAHPRPALTVLVFLLLAVLVLFFWSSMNWFLSIASIFVVRDGSDVFGSVASAVDFCLRHSRAISWTSTVFSACHIVIFVIASSVVVFPLALIGILPAWVILGAIAILTLLYFLVVDFFYVGRLAAYVCILETPEGTSAAFTSPAFPSTLAASGSESNLLLPTSNTGALPPQSSAAWPPIPPSDDDILSDVPQSSQDPPRNLH
jgi:hypothetical protein